MTWLESIPASNLVLLRTVTEAEWQETIREHAWYTGWLYYHVQDSRRNYAGFPDTVLAREGRLVFAELKTEVSKLTKRQGLWLAMLGTVPVVEAYCWRPHDRDDVARVLAPAPGVIPVPLFDYTPSHRKRRRAS